jgi:tRNA dimethylallyltransferase
MNYNLITLLGPTAVGKTRLGALLADRFNGEIISADSRQVYKRMDVGTGKDLEDYVVEGKIIPCHLADVIEPCDEFNLFHFNKLFHQAYKDLSKRKKNPFLVGGTGLYLHSILKNYDLITIEFDNTRRDELNQLPLDKLVELLKNINSTLHNTTDLLIKERVVKAIMIAEKEKLGEISDHNEIKSLTIGVMLDRSEVKKRITARLRHRLQNGMIEEVEKLLKEGISYERLELFGLEYKFIAKYLNGELNHNDMFQKLNSAIHNFAKRQMTWYRKIEKDGIEINWIEGANYEAAEQIILQKYFA